MVICACSLGFLSLGAEILDVSLPAPRLEPVVGKADLGAGKTYAVGGVGHHRLKQVLWRDPVLHGFFDPGNAGRCAAKSIRWIRGQNLHSFFIRHRLALARRWFFYRFNGKVRVPIWDYPRLTLGTFPRIFETFPPVSF